jgi:hypothetical protein
VVLTLSSSCLSSVAVAVAVTTSQRGLHWRHGWVMLCCSYLLCLICQPCPAFPPADHSHTSHHSSAAGQRALLVDFGLKLRDLSLQVHYSAAAFRFRAAESAGRHFDSRLGVRSALSLLCC